MGIVVVNERSDGVLVLCMSYIWTPVPTPYFSMVRLVPPGEQQYMRTLQAAAKVYAIVSEGIEAPAVRKDIELFFTMVNLMKGASAAMGAGTIDFSAFIDLFADHVVDRAMEWLLETVIEHAIDGVVEWTCEAVLNLMKRFVDRISGSQEAIVVDGAGARQMGSSLIKITAGLLSSRKVYIEGSRNEVIVRKGDIIMGRTWRWW